MNFISQIFNLFLYQPLFNALIFLYQFLPGRDFGIAIIVLTSIIRIILAPLMMKSLKSQKLMTTIQPEIKELQQKYKDNPKKQTEEIMAVYKNNNINPLDGLVLLLIQLPILIALYRVFWVGLRPEELGYLYSFVSAPEIINFTFLGLINLSQPNLLLAVLAGIAQLIQSKTMPQAKKSITDKNNKDQTMETISKQMLYFFPIITVLILLKMPSAVGLYWTVTTVFSIIQQHLIFKKI
ncbi:MAG: YidC/Oxa1 family membrane protein insertase [Patescibacteria group bacterium]|nr:YidC/Oxa1 family membrane protein insertase [Patescibacteria group bacterium]MBU1877015.1 YidC/Oxa1 family membrane protein insertase [Patescibacteria group bacterium]